jgi:short-subunit dehydrogenase
MGKTTQFWRRKMRILVIVVVLFVGILLFHVFKPLPAIDRLNFSSRYGPWCIIAGASEGLGESLAHEMAAHGINLVLIARRENILKQVADSVKKQYRVQVRTLAADLSDTEKVLKQIDEMTADIEVRSLVYNAAWSKITNFDELLNSEIDTGINVNIKTPTKLIRQLVKQFKERGSGGILLISSVSGLIGARFITVYSAMKSYQATLARGLWDEMREFGIDIACTIPGAISTPNLIKDVQSSESIPGTQTPQEVASESVRFLASRSGPVMITGKFNRFVLFLLQLLPADMATAFLGSYIQPSTTR